MIAARGEPAARVTVTLSRALVDLFPGAPVRLDIDAGTVDQLVDELDARFPGMADRIRDETPAIRRHLNVFVDGERARLSTCLRAGGAVYILTAMSGG
jgi:sulfur-carrier protein